jgi:predicted metal-dependent phosphoesterase TrpH
MKIDLHIHTRTGSDGALPVEEVIKEAKRRNIGLWQSPTMIRSWRRKKPSP